MEVTVLSFVTVLSTILSCIELTVRICLFIPQTLSFPVRINVKIRRTACQPDLTFEKAENCGLKGAHHRVLSHDA